MANKVIRSKPKLTIPKPARVRSLKPPSQTVPAKPPKRMPKVLPAKSLAKAAEKFKNFSLSRFGGASLPKNYVPAGTDHKKTQRSLITRELAVVANADFSDRSITVSMPQSLLAQALPSLDVDKGTVNINEVLALVTKSIRGTEFYANGDPTLNRLAIQQQVADIISAVKKANS